jgi:hypothetical protein
MNVDNQRTGELSLDYQMRLIAQNSASDPELRATALSIGVLGNTLRHLSYELVPATLDQVMRGQQTCCVSHEMRTS